MSCSEVKSSCTVSDLSACFGRQCDLSTEPYSSMYTQIVKLCFKAVVGPSVACVVLVSVNNPGSISQVG